MNGQPYILGLDIGVASLGWAAIAVDSNDRPSEILAIGDRVWELSNSSEKDVESGKEEPPGQIRRQKRSQRRQLFRRAQRLRKTFRILQEIGLMPEAKVGAQSRHEALLDLDARVRAWARSNLLHPTPELLEHTYLYALRAAALDIPVPPEVLGRIFYHLAQRRGFLSNRKSSKNQDDSKSEILKAIGELEQSMRCAGSRTLGEYLATLNPHERRIRARWTSRRMYREEFEQIWNAQRPHHPHLNEQRKERLATALFGQRPLKSQRSRVGECSLERGRRRAPMGSLEVQEIRYLQRINDLELIDPKGASRPLTGEEREVIRNLAERQMELKFDKIFQKLKIPGTFGEGGWGFNLARGGETKIPGNKTAVQLRRILKTQWDRLDDQRRKQLVDELLSYQKPEALIRRLTGPAWKFDPAAAERLSQVEFESGYHAFSRRAIRRLLPLLREGKRLNAALKEVYPERDRTGEPQRALPPVFLSLRELRNPLVARALTETRKVVNALVRTFGKPVVIRVELARDLKRSREERKKMSEKNRAQEKRRQRAREKASEFLGREAKRGEILKILLAEECDWKCPYTDREISLEALLGPEPQFEIEHILPFSRTLDDSFANKTLCYHEENRVKGQRTPYEAYGGDEEHWSRIISRVGAFSGPFARQKLQRFLQREIPPDFPERHLSDTRYASKLAVRYLGLLYGGVIDSQGKRRVQAVAGTLTAFLRGVWNLNCVLGFQDEKTRDDHRHHAIDALVVALTDAGLVQTVSRLSQVDYRRRPSQWAITPPWGGNRDAFLSDVKKLVHGIITSHRRDNKLSGPLHQESLYAPPVEGRGKTSRTKLRIPLKLLSSTRVPDIVDPVVRKLVEARLEECGTNDPSKAFADEKNLPRLSGPGGGSVVKSVRVWIDSNVIPIGRGIARRYVIPGANHHLEIYAVLDRTGREMKWLGRVVTRLEAVRRFRSGKPLVCRDAPASDDRFQAVFKFTLCRNDYIEWTNEKGERELLRVVAISDNYIELRRPNDARPSTEIRREKDRITARYSTLFARGAKKVEIDLLGRIRPSHE